MIRTAFTYWHQGIPDCPRLVRTCIAQLRSINPLWDINVLDKKSVGDFIDISELLPGKLDRLSLPHRSDLIRTKLLVDHGGVWIDPTVYVTQPFDEWLPTRMSAGLFLFSRPARDRIISNWFIAAEQGHPLLAEFYDALYSYWEEHDFRSYSRKPRGWEKVLNRVVNRNLKLSRLWFSELFTNWLRVSPYMVYHYLFYDLICTRPELNKRFSEIPVVPAAAQCALLWRGLDKEFDEVTEQILQDERVPMQKLTWDTDRFESNSNSVLQWLLTRQN